MQEARDPCARDRAEEQEHDPTEDSLVDTAQEGADLPDEGEEHACDGCDAEDQGVGDLCQRHSARDLRVGRHRRPSDE